jgi:hypothetical protein
LFRRWKPRNRGIPRSLKPALGSLFLGPLCEGKRTGNVSSSQAWGYRKRYAGNPHPYLYLTLMGCVDCPRQVGIAPRRYASKQIFFKYLGNMSGAMQHFRRAGYRGVPYLSCYLVRGTFYSGDGEPRPLSSATEGPAKPENAGNRPKVASGSASAARQSRPQGTDPS